MSICKIYFSGQQRFPHLPIDRLGQTKVRRGEPPTTDHDLQIKGKSH